jgi:hypothetical protein
VPDPPALKPGPVSVCAIQAHADACSASPVQTCDFVALPGIQVAAFSQSSRSERDPHPRAILLIRRAADSSPPPLG